MAKNFGKFLIFTAVIGAACAGVHYYLNHEESASEGSDTFSKDVEKFFDGKKSREYVSLDKVATEESKEALKNAVAQAASDAQEASDESIGVIHDDSQQAADFAFKEFEDNDKPLE